VCFVVDLNDTWSIGQIRELSAEEMLQDIELHFVYVSIHIALDIEVYSGDLERVRGIFTTSLK
jgi:hypothetical protein